MALPIFVALFGPPVSLAALKKLLRQFDAGRNVEIVTGDLLSPADCRKAAEGVSIIYHLAAGMEKSFAGAFMNSALATRNLMDAFLQVGEAKRFVNVSSFAVYSNLSLKRGAFLMKPVRWRTRRRSDLMLMASGNSNRRNSSRNMARSISCLM